MDGNLGERPHLDGCRHGRRLRKRAGLAGASTETSPVTRSKLGGESEIRPDGAMPAQPASFSAATKLSWNIDRSHAPIGMAAERGTASPPTRGASCPEQVRLAKEPPSGEAAKVVRAV